MRVLSTLAVLSSAVYGTETNAARSVHNDLEKFVSNEVDKYEVGPDPMILNKWTTRDYFPEHLHLDPGLDHYYRDWRGGIDYVIDFFVPHIVTDLITYSMDDVGCFFCKAGTGLVRGVFGNKIVTWMINEIAIGGCRVIMKPIVGYLPSTCPGIIN